ncbi:hypothetical protein CTI12_AA238320 [Artemisia annua]|uniref:RNA-directed DNA polymerase, eukaryota, Reverse transcriptase zinc-binding domain protein n=1 Tax=Artemisia annua TaxID=35608 RepID=A0A2U1NQS5_ARTAN|nr:hypothetical protein CTI12_AA238320 [Artemisia annua]
MEANDEDLEVKEEVIEAEVDSASHSLKKVVVESETGVVNQGKKVVIGQGNNVSNGSDIGMSSVAGVQGSSLKQGALNKGNGIVNDMVKNIENIVSKPSNVSTEMPVPFHNNPILNPGLNNVGSTSNVGKAVLNDGNLASKSGENSGSKWPSLIEVVGKENGSNGGNVNGKDTEMVDSVNGNYWGLGNKLSEFPLRVNEFGRKVVDMDPVIEVGSKNWCMTLVGYFMGVNMSYREISGHLRRMWRPYHVDEILVNECGLHFIKFKSDEGLNYVLENGPWLVDGKPFFVQKWEAGLCMVKPEPSKVPIWVKIYNVPLEAWNTEGISSIASSVGNPIIMDRITASMCLRAYGRASFARVLVEVDASRELAESIEICYNKLGKSMNLRVGYDWKPPLCTHCKVFGHDYKAFKVRVWTEEELAKEVVEKTPKVSSVTEKNKEKEVWHEARKVDKNGASTSRPVGVQNYGYRGGFNFRGSGGLNGRGGMSQRPNTGVNFREAPVKGGVEKKIEEDVMRNKSNVSENEKKKNNVAISGNGKDKKVEQEVIKTSNKFDALANDKIEVGSQEWEYMKKKIDMACMLDMKISDDDKSRWTDDLISFWEESQAAKEKATKIGELKGRIAKLQKDIVYGNRNVAMIAKEEAEKKSVELMKGNDLTQNQAFMQVYDDIYRDELSKIMQWVKQRQVAEVDLFCLTGQELTDAIKENWTEEMIQHYESIMGHKVDKMMQDQFYEDVMDGIKDEVAAETHGTAKFMTKDEISKVVDGVDTQMLETQLRKKFVNKVCDEVFGNWVWVSNSVDSKKGFRIAVGWDPTVFSSQLLSQTSQTMHFLVRRLCDNKLIYVSFVYGETNVKDRKLLWKNLRDHYSLAGSCPWVLLGDFNVVSDIFPFPLVIFWFITPERYPRDESIQTLFVRIKAHLLEYKQISSVRVFDEAKFVLLRRILKKEAFLNVFGAKSEENDKVKNPCWNLHLTVSGRSRGRLNWTAIRTSDWPINWEDRFIEVTNVPVRKLLHDVEDKTVWIDKNGNEKKFSVKEVWKSVKEDCPKVIWYKHVWYSQCIPRHAFILWVAIKGRLNTLDRISKWMNIQSMERNLRCFMKEFRDEDCLFKNVAETLKMKLLGLNIKSTSNTVEAARVWDIQLNIKSTSNAYYRRMVEVLFEEVCGLTIFMMGLDFGSAMKCMIVMILFCLLMLSSYGDVRRCIGIYHNVLIVASFDLPSPWAETEPLAQVILGLFTQYYETEMVTRSALHYHTVMHTATTKTEEVKKTRHISRLFHLHAISITG